MLYSLIQQTRYLAPKWRAYVVPNEKGFNFGEGVVARSLLDLKQALLTLPDEIIGKFITPENHIAIWVETVVGDKNLANELRKNSHRWGMVVGLERQLMRTLNTPDYVAQRWLQTRESSFVFVSGEEVRSLPELAEMLKQVSDETFDFHNQRYPNDIATWVNGVIGDYSLAEIIEEAASRDQMQKMVEDHVVMLKEAAE